MNKAITEKQAMKGFAQFMAWTLQTGALPEQPAKASTVKAKTKAAADDLDIGDDLDLGDDLDFGDGLGNELTDTPDPRFDTLRKGLTSVAKTVGGERGKKLAYAILAKFEAQDVDAMADEDLDAAIKLTKAQIAKAKKGKK